MRTAVLIVLLALAAGSAPSAAPMEPNPAPCRKAGCVEREAAAKAPPGATLSYRQCSAGRLEERTYRRVADGWQLQSYTETMLTRCPAAE